MVGHGALTKDVDEPARMCYAEGGGVNFEPIVDAHRQRSGGGASSLTLLTQLALSDYSGTNVVPSDRNSVIILIFYTFSTIMTSVSTC